MPKNLLYTILRAGVHFTGAFAFPAGGALASSLAMHGIEGIANLGINQYNKIHPENQKAPFEINPKVKNAIKLLSSAAVGIAYAYGTLNYEADQILKNGIIQYEQYAADILGSLGGIAAFHKLDIKDTFGAGANLVWNSGKAFSKAINSLEDKILGKSKEKNNTTEKSQNLTLEDLDVDSNLEKSNQDKSHVWDLDLYKDSKVPDEHLKSKVPPSISKIADIQSSELTEEDDKINI